MIERNLGNIERVLRLLAGVCLAIWTMVQPEFSGVEWLAAVISTFLILNGVSGRCYLWHMLAIDSHRMGCSSGVCQSQLVSNTIEVPAVPLASEHVAGTDSLDR